MISDDELRLHLVHIYSDDCQCNHLAGVLDEVERLRAENAENQITINAHIDTGMQFCHLASDAEAKLAKARVAIIDARACYIQTPGQRLSVIAQIDEILVKALKEIDE